MSFPRYPKYKGSGLAWFAEVPEHWQVSRLSQMGRLLKGSGGSKEDIIDDGVPCVRYGDLYTTHNFLIHAARTSVSPDTAKEYTPILRGDVLFAGSGETFEEIGKSAANLIDQPAVCGGDLTILRPTVRVDPVFMGYATDSRPAALQKTSMGRGTTVKHIYRDELKHLVIALPPYSEQVAIGVFLEHEIPKLDALVAQQQSLIELLKEKRGAVISHAVTKGLNPDASMKPSGIGWLGEVPAHWEVKPLRRFQCHVQTGPFGSQLHADEYVTGGTPVINPVNLVQGTIVPSDDVTVTDDVLRRLPRQRLVVGDVVFSRRGELGRCALVTPSEAGWLCGTGSMILRLDHRLHNAEYLSRYLALGQLRQYFESASVGSIMDNLSTATLLALPMVVPPLQEQAAIAAFLSHAGANIDGLVSAAEHAIDLLQERRVALISAAVTGQIDVRGLVPAEVG